ncbi:hypothetical protein ACNJQJ_21850, partial [Mycobacterium tuberculosis]
RRVHRMLTSHGFSRAAVQIHHLAGVPPAAKPAGPRSLSDPHVPGRVHLSQISGVHPAVGVDHLPRAAVEQHLLEVLGASVDVVVDEPVGD